MEAERVLTFIFTVVSDFALVPSLTVTAKNRKHFEVFVGTSAILTGFLYNACDALDVSLFLSKDDWHRINNVMAITYCALLAIYLMCNESDDANTVLRYAAFALVTVAQVRDNFWMEQSQWSMLVILFYALLPLLKFVSQNRIPNYHRQRTKKGLSFALLAALFFVMGLDEKNDRFRISHSVAHVFMGGALYQLWAIVPSSSKRRRRRRGNVFDDGDGWA
eukprot:g729.t1